MKRASTLFLKVAVLFLGVPILLLCIFFVPQAAKVAEMIVPTLNYISSIVMIVFYLSALPYYLALYEAIRILNYIDRNEAFSQKSVDALNKIKYCAIGITVLHLMMLPLFYAFAEVDDAPGVILVGLVVPFGSFVIAVFAAVLKKLLQEAIAIKSENDLTV